MRGKAVFVLFENNPHRITPAYAGKRKLQKQSERIWKDHPRLCGEKPFSSSVNAVVLGSPPPMRGKDHRGTEVQK